MNDNLAPPNFTRRKCLAIATGAFALLSSRYFIGQMSNRPTPFIPNQPELKLIEGFSPAFGTTISVKIAHTDPEIAQAAISATFDEIEAIEQIMSLYRADSQICQLNRQGWLDRPHPYFVEVLQTAQRISALSNGAFDVTVQPLWEACTNPSGMDAIEIARSQVNWLNLSVSPDYLKFARLGMAITLNGIAQGFASDRALAVLQQHGIAHALVDTGEIGSIGEKTNGQPWQIGIQHPRHSNEYLSTVALQGRFLATSGDYRTTFKPDYSEHHIFDPATGRSPTELASVTVLAPTGILADALSTAVFVLGAQKGLDLVRSMAGVDASVTLKNSSTLSTKHWL